MRILMLLSKDWRHDPRVRKEATALRNCHEVTILSCTDKPQHDLFSTIKRLLKFQVDAIRKSRKLDFDSVHAHDLDTLLAGVMISKLRGVPLVYDAHECYPLMVADRLPPDAIRLLSYLEKRLTRHAKTIIVANEKIAPNVTDEPEKCIVVMNCVDEMHRPKTVEGNGFTLGYIGALEPGRFVQGLIEGVKMARNWRLLVVGKGSIDLKGLDDPRIDVKGHVSKEEAQRLLGECDLVSVIFEEGNFNDYIGTPNRLFEAMAMGIPVVANWNTYAGQITNETDCGLTIAPNSFPLSYILNYLDANPDVMREKGMNGKEAWRTMYNWENESRKLLEVYGDGPSQIE